MEVISTIPEMRQRVAGLRKERKKIGLVPTMGYFHEGHLSLMRRSVEDNDFTIVSLFVNPTQFGPKEDLEDYPRDFDRDSSLAGAEGVDCIFAPAVDEIYPAGYKTYVRVEEWSQVMCGMSRPIHFRGVATICCKLFHICRPHRAYFGWKDAQQVLIIKKMVADLNMNQEIIPLPTVREEDGLAMSSRNVYLTGEEREKAVLLYRSLQDVRRMFEEEGQDSAEALKAAVRDILSGAPQLRIDYLEMVSSETLDPVETVEKGTLVAIAAYLGKARLIDNIIL